MVDKARAYATKGLLIRVIVYKSSLYNYYVSRGSRVYTSYYSSRCLLSKGDYKGLYSGFSIRTLIYLSISNSIDMFLNTF